MSFNDVLEVIKMWLVVFWGITQVRIILIHILVNVVAAVAAAIRSGEFRVHRLFEFLWKKLTPLLLVYTVAYLSDMALDNFGWLTTGSFVAIEVTLGADLVGSLKMLGLPIPDAWMAVFRKKEGD